VSPETSAVLVATFDGLHICFLFHTVFVRIMKYRFAISLQLVMLFSLPPIQVGSGPTGSASHTPHPLPLAARRLPYDRRPPPTGLGARPASRIRSARRFRWNPCRTPMLRPPTPSVGRRLAARLPKLTEPTAASHFLATGKLTHCPFHAELSIYHCHSSVILLSIGTGRDGELVTGRLTSDNCCLSGGRPTATGASTSSLLPKVRTVSPRV
jgi:hypothetical protein